jgi:hypothetical protein
VWNLSEGGAKLIVEERKPLPADFILILRPSSPVGRRCQTIWRIGNEVGVRFVSVLDLDKPSHKGSLAFGRLDSSPGLSLFRFAGAAFSIVATGSPSRSN